MGPYHIVDPYPNATTPTLYLNSGRWNLIANMLYLEAPACVGYSYPDDMVTGCRNNDTQQAIDNLVALRNLYRGFPEYANNDLFITGESYAGVYVPTLAIQILKNAPEIKLKGIAVGNGVVGAAGQDGTRLSVEYLHGHALYSQSTYKNIMANCPDFRNPSATCRGYLNDMRNQVGHVNIYDVFGPCINRDFPQSNKEQPILRRPLEEGEENILLGPNGPDACLDAGAATTYLNRPEVKAALHVPAAFDRTVQKWVLCTSKLQYSRIQPSLLPDYRDFLIPKIRVLIYNGDGDACVPYNGNEEWTSGLGIPATSAWHAWTIDRQVQGYATTYQSNFAFVTIKGAGHMVPQTHPKAGLEMFNRFLDNKAWD